MQLRQSGRPADSLRQAAGERRRQREPYNQSSNQSSNQSRNQSRKDWIHSSTVFALAIFFVVNGCLALAATIHSARSKNVDQNGVWQTIESALEQYRAGPRPAIVLLGSSLVMSPLWTADFKRFSGVADFYRHHRSYLLERNLEALASRKRQNGKSDKCRVFSFAVPGAMVSDMDLILGKVLVGPRKPDLVVYGVAPRDFMDDLAGSETKTVVFQKLGDVGDLSKSNFADTSIDEKLELVVNKMFYLFGKRTRYQAKTDSFLRKIAHQSARDSTDQLLAAANANICPLFQDRKILWQKSLDEYRMRYQRFNQLQYRKQQAFLQDLLATCHKNDIAILLVNMPLTRANLDLMPPGQYENYLSMLRECAKRNDVSLVDLHSDQYPDLSFYDTVHLNDEGAQTFLSTLSQAICREQDRAAQIRAVQSVASKQKALY
jgi:hypothetical protein